MTRDEALKILAPPFVVRMDGSVSNDERYMSYAPEWKHIDGVPSACLDSDFTADELEAIAYFMRYGGA